MNRVDDIKRILKIVDNDYRHGTASVYVDFKAMQKLKDAELFNLDYARKDGPKNRDFYDFMEKHKDKKINARLMVIDPRREDFRIAVQVIAIGSQYAKLKTNEDIEFWSDFMALGRQGDSCMAENNEWVSWCWYS